MTHTKPLHNKKDHEQVLEHLMELLKADEQWHVDQLAERLGSRPRTVYLYLNELEERGIRINRNNGHPRLYDISFGLESNLTAADFRRGRQILDRLGAASCRNKEKIDLLKELRNLMNPYFRLLDGNQVKSVAAINAALSRHVQVVIHSYRSGNSGRVEDRLVEPVAWSPEGRQISAYDVKNQGMRTFVPSRMGRVEVTSTPWQHAKRHEVPEYDLFWMSGEPHTAVLRLSLLALNLLHEEKPRSRELPVEDVSAEDPEHPYQIAVEYRNKNGVGRFVRGLPDHVVIVSGLEL